MADFTCGRSGKAKSHKTNHCLDGPMSYASYFTPIFVPIKTLSYWRRIIVVHDGLRQLCR